MTFVALTLLIRGSPLSIHQQSDNIFEIVVTVRFDNGRIMSVEIAEKVVKGEAGKRFRKIVGLKYVRKTDRALGLRTVVEQK